MTATTKTTAKKTTAKAAKQATQTTQATHLQALMIEALKKRIETAPNDNYKKNLDAELRFFNDVNGQIIIEKCSSVIDVRSLAEKISISIDNKSHIDFVAVYALQKIRKMMYAIANNRASFIDGYSKSIIHNMVKLQELTNKSALVALSRDIEYSETDKIQEIKRLISVAVGTASTQASSTRQMLRLLNIANVTKRKNGDEFGLLETETAKHVESMFKQA